MQEAKIQDNSDNRENSRRAWIGRAEEIWGESARRLILSMRYLYQAINAFDKKPDGRFTFTATDGDTIYYNPMKFVTTYERGIVHINRAFMHIVMHCIFRAVHKSVLISEEERKLWDLASDIHAEYIIDGMDVQELLLPESDLRISIYKYLTDKCGILSIENIFTCLKNESESKTAGWSELFYSDDHSLWYHSERENADKWERRSRQIMTALSASGIGKGEERLVKSMKLSEKKPQSYETFLRKFMRLREETRLDPDSFDPAYYHYGMSVYGDMPLIEEQETKEEHGVDELIIVIDTSGSCADGQIEKFLEETAAILSSKGVFSHKSRVRLLQCDREVLSDTLISPGTLAGEQLNKVKIKGYGGTDFRPAFRYVRENVTDAGRISGMIYFTDGYGLYPVMRPPWKTAFVFSKEPDFEDEERMRILSAASDTGERVALKPPAWAMTHTLDVG